MKSTLLLFFLCTFSALSQNLEHVWSSVLFVPEQNEFCNAMRVVIDDHNNKYIYGKFRGTCDFDPGPGQNNITSLGLSDVFVLKLDSLNNFLWANSYGVYASSTSGAGIVVDTSGNVYTYGSFTGDLYYDPQNSLINLVTSTWVNSDCYVHKLDQNGNFEWIKAWGNSPGETISNMIIDDQNNFYLTGNFGTSFDVDAGPGVFTLSTTTSGHSFLAKYNADFNFLWAKNYTGSGTTLISSLAQNTLGELTLTGRYQGVVDFDLGLSEVNDTSFAGTYDMFAQVIDTSGAYKWHYTQEGYDLEVNNDCIEDSNRNRYIVGLYYDELFLNNSGEIDTIVPFGFSDSYLTKLDSLGNHLWTKFIQGEDSGEIFGIRKENDQLIIYGTISSATDIDPTGGFNQIQAPLSINDMLYIEKLDGNGNVLWHEEFIGSMILTIMDFQIDQEDNYFVIGALNGTADMDPSQDVTQISGNLITNSGTSHFTVFGELPCAPLGADLSDHSSANCSSLGEINATGVGGTPPYNFTWLTDPPVLGNLLATDTSGLYFVEVTDANGCKDTANLYLNGPNSSTGFDLDVNLVYGSFIQGQPGILWLDAYNGSCSPVSGTVKLVLDPLVQFDSATVIPTLIVGDTLFWDFDSWNYETTNFITSVYVTTSQSAITGDTVCFKAMIDPVLGDIDTLNNSKEYCDPILASYDPNDKKVYPKGICDDHVYMGESLTYTVRFQNTGNSAAINVNIIDVLDENLDPGSVEILGKSHPQLEVNFRDDRELQFNFQNIHLPDSLTDPVGSNGYVIFKVSPKTGMTLNSVVSNYVNIYFDFNSPILTNTVTNTYTNNIPCISTDNVNVTELFGNEFELYPNPAGKEVTLVIQDELPHSLAVYNPLGLTIFQLEVVSGATIDLGDLPNGIYLFQLDGSYTIRVVKE